MPVQFITSKINVEVNRRPVTPERLVPRPKIVKKDAEGNEVKTMYRPKILVGHNENDGKPIFRYLYMLCPECEPASPDEKCPICNGIGRVAHFSNYEKVETVNGIPFTEEVTHWIQHPDGKEELTSKFPRSDVLKVQMEMPRSKLHEFYFDGGWDELESPIKKKKGEKVHNKFVEQELYKEAERYIAKGIIGAGKFVKSESFREWFFICFPTILDNGKFGWLVGYTTCKIEQSH